MLGFNGTQHVALLSHGHALCATRAKATSLGYVLNLYILSTLNAKVLGNTLWPLDLHKEKSRQKQFDYSSKNAVKASVQKITSMVPGLQLLRRALHTAGTASRCSEMDERSGGGDLMDPAVSIWLCPA